jgi:hypothetical protein
VVTQPEVKEVTTPQDFETQLPATQIETVTSNIFDTKQAIEEEYVESKNSPPSVTQNIGFEKLQDNPLVEEVSNSTESKNSTMTPIGSFEEEFYVTHHL